MRISDWSSDVCSSDLLVEEDLVQLVIARRAEDRLHRHAVQRHVDQQETDALLRLHMRIGADQSEQPVRMVRLRGPDLVARHDIMVAVAHGAGPQAGEVRSEEHTSELQSLMRISYAVFSLHKKK